MALFLKALAKCDMPGCEFKEEVEIKFDVADGPSLFMIGNLPPPPNWEAWSQLGRKLLRCPECAVKRKKGRFKVVPHAEETEADSPEEPAPRS